MIILKNRENFYLLYGERFNVTVGIYAIGMHAKNVCKKNESYKLFLSYGYLLCTIATLQSYFYGLLGYGPGKIITYTVLSLYIYRFTKYIINKTIFEVTDLIYNVKPARRTKFQKTTLTHANFRFTKNFISHKLSKIQFYSWPVR